MRRNQFVLVASVAGVVCALVPRFCQSDRTAGATLLAASPAPVGVKNPPTRDLPVPSGPSGPKAPPFADDADEFRQATGLSPLSSDELAHLDSKARRERIEDIDEVLAKRSTRIPPRWVSEEYTSLVNRMFAEEAVEETPEHPEVAEASRAFQRAIKADEAARGVPDDARLALEKRRVFGRHHAIDSTPESTER